MKEKIIEKAIELFEKKGFSTTSIQDIVDELGVTKGSFYYHFSSKEQLLMDIYNEYITNLLDRQTKIIANKTLSPKEQLIEIIRLLIDDLIENGPRARIYFREMRHLSENHINTIKKIRKQFRKNIEMVIRTGEEQGVFRNQLPADILAFALLGLTNWSYNWYTPDGEIPPDQLVKIYSELLLTGLLDKDHQRKLTITQNVFKKN
ncbi:TetR/AcrR family transcriptional regulator [Caldibacillus sp. 210928-DFI.2.22]|nr:MULTISPECIES: TetR/AcrR family transcriptional regulator [unclassified Caldibacillus]MCB7068456.1 TetR/AcrR family transcriptional regulator [Caldibacillus sp. 210928-DFI.2.22]MCB7071855.1 TetR/AcrR family transcriptional regulator [Caldibacillus sp. 210928-DFI.2.18]